MEAFGVFNGIFANLSTAFSIPWISFASRELYFGGTGSTPGMFQDVRGLGVNPSTGAIFAANYNGGRVQAFDPSGKFIKEWTVKEGQAQVLIPGMAADRNGNVYIAAGGKVLRYDSSGNLQATLDIPDSSITNLVIGSDGSLIAGAGETIIQMTPDGKVLSTIQNVFTGNGGSPESLGMTVAVDSAGDVYALGRTNHAVFKFSPQGQYISRFGSQGSGKGQFDDPACIAVDGFGRIFVGDAASVQVFDASGRTLNAIYVGGTPRSLAFDNQNKLYITVGTDNIFLFRLQKP